VQERLQHCSGDFAEVSFAAALMGCSQKDNAVGRFEDWLKMIE